MKATACRWKSPDAADRGVLYAALNKEITATEIPSAVARKLKRAA